MDIQNSLPEPVVVTSDDSLVITKIPSNKKLLWIIVAILVISVITLAPLIYLNRGKLPFLKKTETEKRVIPTVKPHDTINEEDARRIQYKKDVPVIYADINEYLKSKNRPPISEHNVSTIDSKDLLDKLNTKAENFVAIDIRERRETETLLRLNDYPNLRYIRLGDLINSNEISKDVEIAILGFTENRETVAADYLLSQGYKDVKILRGGLLLWVNERRPTTKNVYVGPNTVLEDINSVLSYIEKPASSTALLNFGPYSSNNISMLLMDSEFLDDYINSLPRDKEYVLKCDDNKFCYEASYFWYEAKDRINIIGYTGNTVYTKPSDI